MGLFSSIFGGSESTQVTNPDQLAAFQQPLLQALQGGAVNLARGQQAGIGSAAAGLSNEFLNQGRGFLSQLGGAGQGIPGIGMQAAQAQQQALTQGLQQNLDFGLNQIQNRFGSAGSVGSRAGLAGQTLLGQNQQALAQGTADIFGQQGALNLGAGQLGAQSAQAGLGSLGSLFNLGLSPFSAQFQPFQQAAGVIGNPIVLGQGGSSSQSTAPNIFGSLAPGGFGLPGLFGGAPR